MTFILMISACKTQNTFTVTQYLPKNGRVLQTAVEHFSSLFNFNVISLYKLCLSSTFDQIIPWKDVRRNKLQCSPFVGAVMFLICEKVPYAELFMGLLLPSTFAGTEGQGGFFASFFFCPCLECLPGHATKGCNASVFKWILQVTCSAQKGA